MTDTGDALARLDAEGVSIWLDDISRDRLLTGNLRGLVEQRRVVGVTSNPTIFQAAISKSSAYDAQLDALRSAGADRERAVREITVEDVRQGCDLLAATVQGRPGDGRVSLEVDPRLAHDTAATVEQARELWAQVGRPNLYIKIPATRAGLPAITTVIAEGISVNVTLIFALERYAAVMDAYATGLERRLAEGAALDGIASVASFFVSRVDTEVDKRLDATGGDRDLRGQAAVANARLAYAAFEEFVATPRWQRLEAAGAPRQRPLWASTSTKDPDLPDTLYVTELVAPGTVNTMPEPTIEAVAEHGEIRGDTVRGAYADARATMAALAAAGIDMEDVTRVLEEEGVEKFETSWNDLLATVEARLEASR